MAATPPASIACTNSEWEIRPAPQAEPLGIGKVVDRGGAGGRDIEHAGFRQRVLQPQSRTSLLRGRLVAALALGAGRVLHGVAFVEDDDTVEVAAQPIDDLLDTGNPFLAGVEP